MGLLFVWFVLSMPIGAAMASPDLPLAVRAIAGCLIAGPALLWVGSVKARRARADEFDASLAGSVLSQGAQWWLLFAPLLLAIQTISDAVGFTHGHSLQETAFGLVCIQAPAAALFGEWNAHSARRRFARTGA
jgi:hypothetical protein